MKRLFSVALLAFIAALSSCDTSTEPMATGCSLENFAKLQTGNWWVYESYNTDMDGVMLPGTNRLDSVVVEGTEVKFGKTAYILINYSTNDGGITYTRDSTWMAVEGGQVYVIDSTLFPLSCNCLGRRWVQFADCSADAWTVLDSTREDRLPTRITLPGSEDSIVLASVQFRYLIDGRSGGETTMEIGTEMVPVRKFAANYNIYVQLIEPEDAELIPEGKKVRQVKPMSFLLAEHIGLVGLDVEAEKPIYTRADGSERTHTDDPRLKPGLRRTLLRWSVK